MNCRWPTKFHGRFSSRHGCMRCPRSSDSLLGKHLPCQKYTTPEAERKTTWRRFSEGSRPSAASDTPNCPDTCTWNMRRVELPFLPTLRRPLTFTRTSHWNDLHGIPLQNVSTMVTFVGPPPDVAETRLEALNRFMSGNAEYKPP